MELIDACTDLKVQAFYWAKCSDRVWIKRLRIYAANDVGNDIEGSAG